MTEYVLRVCIPAYQDLASGLRTFEVCKDRGYSVGDILLLWEYRPGYIGRATGRECRMKVTYLMRHQDFPAGIPEGYCVMSIAPEARE